MTDVSRRGFLKGAGVAAASAAIANMVGCAPKEAEPVQPEPVSTDWLGEAPALTVADCAKTIETEIVCVGAGLSGSMAAYGALKSGAKKVIMIDRNDDFHIGGMEASFLNAKAQIENGVPEYNKISIVNELMREMQMTANFDMWAVWANRSGEIFDSLKADVLDPYGQFYEYDIMENFYPDPEVEISTYNSCGIKFDDDGDKMGEFITNLHKWLKGKGVEVHYLVRGEKLVQEEDGTVTGIICHNSDGSYTYYKASKGVIMCTGSFGADEKMMHEFFPEHYAKFALNYNSYFCYNDKPPVETIDDGLGHKMLCWAGAEMEDYCSGQAWMNKSYKSFPYLLVNSRGDRFINEATPGLMFTHILTRQPDFDNFVWQIIPTNDFDMPSVFGMPKAFLEMMGALDCEHLEADTIEELAVKMEVPVDRLVATVKRYNEMCEKGEDEDFLKAPRYMDPIDDGPYQAWKADSLFYCTTGGVWCDNKLRVLDKSRVEIPGLYAAGNTVGGRFGSCYQNLLHGGTNSLAFVHGYVAGESAAKGL